jgi:hypothetical protein
LLFKMPFVRLHSTPGVLSSRAFSLLIYARCLDFPKMRARQGNLRNENVWLKIRCISERYLHSCFQISQGIKLIFIIIIIIKKCAFIWCNVLKKMHCIQVLAFKNL